MPPIRFAIMCDSDTIEDWQGRCLRTLLKAGAEPVLIIRRADVPFSGRPKTWMNRVQPWSALLWRLYVRLYVLRRSRAMKSVPIADILPDVPIFSCQPVKKGKSGVALRPEDLAAIRKSGPDFILLFGFGILKGEILDVARYGVWSFHHDDPAQHRGLPPGFWEIYLGDLVNGAILQRLNSRLDAGIVLQRGWVKTIDYSYVRNLDSVYYSGVCWPARVVADIRNGVASYMNDPPLGRTAPIRHVPTNRQTLRFFGILLRATAHRFLRAAFRTEQWAVGIVDSPIESFLDAGVEKTVHWLPEPGSAKFLADPFAVLRNGRLDILAEEFDYRTGRGIIASVEIRPDGQPAARWRAMQMPVHLSYPYVIHLDGEIYCVPETSEAREAALYRAVSFPTRWEKNATLIHDFAAADSTTFRHDDHWWLFCTDRDADVDASLHAWYADSLFGPWQPHASNPIKTDIRSSRPAGTPFVSGGRLYRPAQDSSRVYAGAVVVHEVIRLTPTEFVEVPVVRLDPFPGSSYPDGTHTLCAAGDRTIIDAKREIFMLPALWARVRHVVSKS